MIIKKVVNFGERKLIIKNNSNEIILTYDLYYYLFLFVFNCKKDEVKNEMLALIKNNGFSEKEANKIYEIYINVIIEGTEKLETELVIDDYETGN